MNSQLNINPEELELIDRYISGELTADEQQLFQQRLATDSQWKEKLLQVQLMSAAIGEAALREQLPRFHNSIAAPKQAPVKKMRLGKWAAAAAIVAAIFLIGKFTLFNQSATQKVYASFYKQDPGLPTEMGVSENYAFDRAMVDYKTGNYTQAAAVWEQLLANYPNNDTLQYFIASAQMGQKKWQPAIDNFSKVIAQNSAFKADAFWYKGMALLQLNKKEEAIASIEASNHPQKTAILSKLKK